MMHLGNVPASSTLYIPFATYASTGASVTLTGLAVTDIEIYKNGSTTQRASDAGYALLDTDGIDFDGITGIHGFSIDLSDNTDASFYAVGSFYWVVVSAVTVNAVTVNFIAATFRIVAAEAIAGKPKVDVDGFGGSAITSAAGIPEVKVASIANNAITAASIAADAITDAKVASDVTIASVTGAVGSVTGNVGGNVSGSVGSVVGAVGSVTGNVGGNVTGSVGSVVGLTVANLDVAVSTRLATAGYTAPDNTSIAAILVDTAEIGAAGAGLTALASQASVNTIDDFLDTEIAAIKAKTDNLPAAPAAVGDIPTAGAIADAVHDEVVDGTLTFREATRLQDSALFGKLSGAATTSIAIRDAADTKDRIVATVDADGNRSAVTLDP